MYNQRGCLITLLAICVWQSVRCSVVLDSMEVVSCSNKNVCQNGKNLRIVVNASAIESAAGTGSITGTIDGGEGWSDDNGDWELLHSLAINIEYENAMWEYQLQDDGIFYTKGEDLCGPFMTPCSSYENGIACVNKGDWGLSLQDVSECTRYSIVSNDKWTASVSVSSTNLDLQWQSSNQQHSTWQSDVEISLTASFDTGLCYQDLSSGYYVVVPETGNQYYYFTSKQYWQNSRNNFNFSLDAWQRDFDCDFEWKGWHTIIPFFQTDEEYTQFADGNNIRVPMSGNQLYAFANGYIPSIYKQVVDAVSGDCIDMSTYADHQLDVQGQPENDKYLLSQIGIVDHFQMTLDLHYTQFVQMPTHSPTPNPTNNPTKPPTSSPTKLPTQSPSANPTQRPTPSPTKNPTKKPTSPPTESPTQRPSKNPTQRPTPPPTQTPTNSPTQLPTPTPTVWIQNNKFNLYELQAKLELTSSFHINISARTVQNDIIQSIASGLSIGREFVRLDNADMITGVSGRRLQANTEALLLDFTVFTLNPEQRLFYVGKLEETSTYHFILSALSHNIPHILSIFVANVADDCAAGTKPVTVLGQKRCRSICLVNQVYDTALGSCRERRVQANATQIIIIEKDIVDRVMWFCFGFFGPFVAVGVVYGSYMWWTIRRLSSRKKKKSKSKKRVKNRAHPIDNTDSDNGSVYSETELHTIKQKFSASLGKKKSRSSKSKKKATKTSNSQSYESVIDSSESGESSYGSSSQTESD